MAILLLLLRIWKEGYVNTIQILLILKYFGPVPTAGAAERVGLYTPIFFAEADKKGFPFLSLRLQARWLPVNGAEATTF